MQSKSSQNNGNRNETEADDNKERVLFSNLIEKGPPTIYEPISTIVNMNKDRRIATRVIGKDNPLYPAPGRVIMVVGATGSGKSTLINGITNYVYGVKWGDSFRYKLIVDEGGRSQSKSQTTWITAYTFHKTEHSILPYTLTIIDTPGFGDTRGIERDKEIADQIKELFTDCRNHVVDQLHCIAFVAQATAFRLTPTQRYIFDVTLSIFGKDIANNIMLVATFADGKQPTVYEAAKEANVPFHKAFKFNNSALYSPNESEDPFDKLFWDMGKNTFVSFFNEFVSLKSQSLYLTREVLKERERLEITLRGLQPQIQLGLAKIDVLKQERCILQKHEAQINESKDFTYRVKEQRHRQVPLTPGQKITNCQVCHTTCHFPCEIANDAKKASCDAMNSNGTCNVCPGHCSWKEHFNTPYRYEIYTEEVERTSEDLKARYMKAVGGKSEMEKAIAGMETEMQGLIVIVHDMMNAARTSIERLKKIALKPNPMTEVEYLDLLIESELNEHAEGFQQRINVLKKFRKQALLLSVVAKSSEEKKGWCETIQSLVKDLLEVAEEATTDALVQIATGAIVPANFGIIGINHFSMFAQM